MLSSGHEHSFICSLSFNVITVLKNNKKCPEGCTLGVRFFTAFCNHWRCTCAMVLSLPCSHWQFLLGFSAMAKQNQNPKKNEEQKTKNLKNKKQNKKKENHGDCRISNGFGFFVFFVFYVFFGFLQGALPKESPKIFCWFNDFFNSLPGILPKEYQNIVVFLFVWRCAYEYVQIAAKCEHKKWTCYIVNHRTKQHVGGSWGGGVYICNINK